MTDLGLDPMRIVLAAGVAAGLMLLAVVLLRRLRPIQPAGTDGRYGPRTVAQCALDMRHRVVVVRYGRTDHLILLGQSAPLLLGCQDAGDGVRSEGAVP